LYVFTLFCIIASVLLLYSFLTRIPAKMRGSLEKFRVFNLLFKYGDEARNIHKISPFIFGISFIGWVFRGLEWYCIASAVGMASFSLADGLFLNPLLTLLSFIPITPAGIGIQEAGIVGIFLLIHVDQTAATYFAIINRFTEALVDALGLRSFYGKGVKHQDLHKFYGSIDGDIDEKAYNSDLFVQRYFQQRRTRTIHEHLNIRHGDIFLDIGCGSGVQLAKLASSTYSLAIGIDLNRNALKYARRRGLPNTEFIIADVQYLPIKAGVVQKILCSEVIEHLDSPASLVNELRRVLGRGGEVVLTTPNENSPWGLYEFAWDIFGRGRNYGDTHLKFYSPREILEFFQKFQETYVRTLFFGSPFIALLNNEALVSVAERIDSLFEEWNLGVLIIVHAKMGDPPASEV
jgi:ubiquinone/menaquinone biosynthesis C-methylase UbiE